MANLLDNPERWRLRAEEMRKVADDAKRPRGQTANADLAISYEKKLAKHAEGRAADDHANPCKSPAML